MKRILVLSAFLFVCFSMAFAAHPLIGKWRFREVIGGVPFYDYVTITSVSVTTKKVLGHVTGLTDWGLTGYYIGNNVFLTDDGQDFCLDGYYFTFQGTKPLKKYLIVISFDHDFDSSWYSLTTKKLSSSTASADTMTLSDLLNQKALKKQARLREIGAANKGETLCP